MVTSTEQKKFETVKKPPVKRITLRPIEREFNLTEVLSFELEGQNVGGLLLRKGKQFKIVFGFSCEGIHNLLPQSEVSMIYDPLVDGLIDFPAEESLTIHQQLFVNSAAREEELIALAENAPSDELRFLVKAARKRLQELTAKGLRKEIKLDFYCSYTTTEEGSESKDRLDKILKKIDKLVGGFFGEKEQQENQQLEQVLDDAYYQGFETWFNFLSQKLALPIKPLATEEIWQRIVERFTNKEVEVPQIIHVTNDGLELTQNSELHPVSRIFLESEPPVASEQYLQNKGKYISVHSLEEKVDAWKDARTQLQYMWRVLSKPEVRDTEIFVQLTRGDIVQQRENMRRLAEQAKREQEEYADKNMINLGVGKRIEKAIAAGEALYDDKIPLKTAVLFVVHRDSPKELDRAYRFLKEQFRTPLVLTKENIYPYELWIQTFPICWHKLLIEYDRRNTYSSTEVLGIMPLVQPFSPERSGLEFLSAEGGIPIFLDLWTERRHLMILATSRAGKGILLAKTINSHLARGIPVSIIDYPNEDGTGTFTDYAGFLSEQASYFSPEREKINIFEIPNLSHLSEQDKEIRMGNFKDGVMEILEVMVCGCNPRPEIDTTTIKSLLAIAVSFFYSQANEKIHRRFVNAFKGGFGSEAWQKTPTLYDFMTILGFERLGISSPSDAQVKAMKFIRLRLEYWLNNKIGRSLAAPSTIQPSSTLLTVYALTKLNDPDDASVLTLAINQEAERKSMSHPYSEIIVDEFSIQVELEAIAKMVARRCASGLKAGISMTLVGQDMDSVLASPYKGKIVANTPTRLIGLMMDGALDGLKEAFKYESEVIEMCSSKKFLPITSQLATNWLLDNGKTLNHVRFYSDAITLAVAANNPNQVQRRQELMNQYQEEGKYVAIHAYAEEIKEQLGVS